MMFAGRGRGKIRPPRRVSQESVNVNVLFCVDHLCLLPYSGGTGILDYLDS